MKDNRKKDERREKGGRVQRSQLVSQHVVEASCAKETEKRERRGGTSRVGLPPHLLSLPTDVDKILHGPCERDTKEPFPNSHRIAIMETHGLFQVSPLYADHLR